MLLLLLLSCGPKTPAPAETPVPVEEPPKSPLQAHMSEHFQKATAARDALIYGQIDAARADLTWLAEHVIADELPDVGEAWLEPMRKAAAAGAEAQGAEAMGEQLGKLGLACGSCHDAMGASPKLRASLPPLPDEGLQSHMGDHAWAVERMWASLVVPDADAWTQAVELIGTEPLPEEEFGVPEMSDEALAFAARVHESANAAVTDPTDPCAPRPTDRW